MPLRSATDASGRRYRDRAGGWPVLPQGAFPPRRTGGVAPRIQAVATGRPWLVGAVLAIGIVPTVSADGCRCYEVTPTPIDSAANVRASPDAAEGKIVQKLEPATIVVGDPKARFGAPDSRWIRLGSLSRGFVHRSQVTAVDCSDADPDLAETKRIRCLAARARNGDPEAIADFLTRDVDGDATFDYSDELGAWAIDNPGELAAAIKRLPPSVRAKVEGLVHNALKRNDVSLYYRGRFRAEMLGE